MSDKIKFTIEYEIKSSPRILFGFLNEPNGLTQWFADRAIPRRIFVPCVISRTPAPRFEIGPVAFEFVDNLATSDLYLYSQGGGDADESYSAPSLVAAASSSVCFGVAA